MATNESILLQVDVAFNAQRLIDLQKQLDENKKATAELNKSFKDGKISQDEYAKMQVRLAGDARALRGEQTLLNKINDTYIKGNEAAAGSVDQLKIRSAQLTAQYNALSKEARTSTEAGKALAAELKDIDEQIKEAKGATQSFGSALLEAAKGNEVLGQVVEKGSGIQEKFATAQNLARLAMGKTTGAAGVLRVALLALPIFAVIAVLGTLYGFLTRTQAGMDFVERKTAAVGTALSFLGKIAEPIGAGLLRLFTEPSKAADDFVKFLETNVSNRVSAFGVLLEAIQNKDFRKLKDGVIQLTTGVTDGTAKFKAFQEQVVSATNAGERIALTNQQIRESERALNVERAKSEARVESLKFLAEDVTKSTKARLDATREAFAIEQSQEQKAIQLQQRRIDNLKAEQRLSSVTAEDRNKLAEEEIKLAGIQTAARTRQTELQNKINEIQASGAAAALAQVEKELAAQRAALQLRNDLLDQELRKVITNSAEEEKILKQKLANTYAIELLQKGLSVEQRKLMETKYNQDVSDLTAGFARRRQIDALQIEADTIKQKLLLVKDGGDEQAELQRQLIDKELAIQVAGLDTKQNNAAKERLLTTEAEQKEQETRYKQATKALNGFLQETQIALETANAKGELTEDEYQQGVYRQALTSVTARTSLAEQFNKDTADLAKERTDLEIDELQRLTAAEKAETERRGQALADFAIGLGVLFAETLTDSGAKLEAFVGKVLILIIDLLEKEVLAAQTTAVVNAFATKGLAGALEAAAILAITATIFEGAKAVLNQGLVKQEFAKGGAVRGPGTGTSDSIEVGGPLPGVRYFLSNGEHIWTAKEVEAAGGHSAVEALRRAVVQPRQDIAMPIFELDRLAGPETRFALGGAVGDGGYALRAASDRGTVIDYPKLGKAVADAQQLIEPIDYPRLGQEVANAMPDKFDFESFKRGMKKHDRPRELSSVKPSQKRW